MATDKNLPATISLVAGLLTLVLMFVGLCLGFMPWLGLIALLLYPVQLICAVVALVTGVIGYRSAVMLEGVGRGSALVGVGISVAWFILQFVLWVAFTGIMGLAILGDVLTS